MSNIIEKALEPTSGYVISMTRDTVHGWYELEVGIPSNWVYSGNENINCEILNEVKDVGRIIKVTQKNDEVNVDDLYYFVELIIHTNQKIAEKEEQFKTKMSEMKNLLEKEAKSFYEELDKLKEDSFKDLTGNTPKKQRGRPSKKETPKIENESVDDNTIEDVDQSEVPEVNSEE